MAEKAHRHLAKVSGAGDLDDATLHARHGESLHYNRVTGNSYTASLYVGLASLLEKTHENLAGHRIGLFSYGSGCMATFFSGIVLAGYRDHLHRARHASMLEQRHEVTYQEYERFYNHRLPTDGSDYKTARFSRGRFRLAGIQDHKRIYEVNAMPVRAATQQARAAEHVGV